MIKWLKTTASLVYIKIISKTKQQLHLEVEVIQTCQRQHRIAQNNTTTCIYRELQFLLLAKDYLLCFCD